MNTKFVVDDIDLNPLIEAANADYDKLKEETKRWKEEEGISDQTFNMNIMYEMAERFRNGWSVLPGSKYIKIVHDSSVHCFVVRKDTNKFKKGDILKAASWSTPSLNKARGNVLTGDLSKVLWTGVEYLK